MAKEPTLYIRLSSAGQNSELALASAIAKTAFGTQRVQELVATRGEEADIAVTDDTGIALSMLNETSDTTIVIMCYPNEATEATRFASRFPARVKAFNVTAFVLPMLQLIEEKHKAQRVQA